MKLKKILTIVLAVAIVLGLTAYNMFLGNPNQLTVREEILTSEKIDKDLDGLQIAWFSDVHYGTLIDETFLNRMVEKIGSFTPDVILFGGDLFESMTVPPSEEDAAKVTALLSSLNARLGKYAVLGDYDESSAQIEETVRKILKDADFRIIDNTSARVFADKDSYFDLVGIDSRFFFDERKDMETVYNGVSDSTFTLVMTHCPDVFHDIPKQDTDYVLAGHSRGAQIYIPFFSSFRVPEGSKEYYHGKYIVDGLILDVSNGVGMVKEKVRLMADAEVVMLQLDSGS